MRLHPARAVGLLRAPWIPGWSKDPLWRRARAVPSLDLRFADNKSLVDATTGANLVTFSRASGATYVDSQGVIRNAVTNLLLRSEEFDNASWAKGVNTTVTVNYAVAPNGTTTADRIEMPASTGTVVSQSATVVSGLVYTFSVYARATATTSPLVLQLGTNTASYTLTPQWQRYSISFTATATSLTAALDNGDNAIDILAWGAQLEQSSTVGEYVPTTSTINSAPRFDHNPTTGESLGLLVEESRTNLLLRSEEFNDGSWVATNSSVSSDQAVAPNGTLTADKLLDNSTNGQHWLRQDRSVASNTAHTISVFFKQAERSRVRFGLLNNALINGAYAEFNLASGTISNQVTAGTASGVSFAISLSGDGWYRCHVSCVVDNSSTVITPFIGVLDANGNPTYVGDGTSGIYLWGAQLEAGAFPTSYIKTEASAATRAADIASITDGVGSGSNFSSWYRQDQGTMFAEGAVAQPASGGNQFFFRSSDSGYNNSVALNVQSSGFASLATAAGGVFDGLATSSLALSANTTAKFAGAYAANNLGLSLNGATAITDATATMPTAQTRADISSDHAGVNRVKAGTIRRLTYWPQRLGNEVLQRITQ